MLNYIELYKMRSNYIELYLTYQIKRSDEKNLGVFRSGSRGKGL